MSPTRFHTNTNRKHHVLRKNGIIQDVIVGVVLSFLVFGCSDFLSGLSILVFSSNQGCYEIRKVSIEQYVIVEKERVSLSIAYYISLYKNALFS